MNIEQYGPSYITKAVSFEEVIDYISDLYPEKIKELNLTELSCKCNRVEIIEELIPNLHIEGAPEYGNEDLFNLYEIDEMQYITQFFKEYPQLCKQKEVQKYLLSKKI